MGLNDATVQAGIVRVQGPSGATAGTGFLVRGSDGLLRILTCSHVIQDPATQQRGAPRPERVDIAFLDAPDDTPHHAARVETWVPFGPPGDGDIAVLRLDRDPPAGVEALPLGIAEHARDQSFASFGFPANAPGGIWAKGDIRGLVDGRMLQLGASTEITAGFSGAPLLAVEAQRVVGMVSLITAPDRLGRLTETAFAIPTELIRKACPVLEPSDVCPYRGLMSFTRDDARYFFGQDPTIDRLERELARSPRALAVLGPSGSGKSSIVHAGLTRRLEGDPWERRGTSGPSWQVIATRPADALPVGPEAAREPRDGPRACAQSWGATAADDRRLLLVVDQFEELLAHEDAAARDRYLAELVEVIDDRSVQVSVLVVIRSDFYGRLAEVAPLLLDRLEHGKLDVPPWFGTRDLRAIVLEPARRVGLGFEEGLVDRIVSETIAAAPAPSVPDAARSTVLPLLEAALTDLWEGRSEGLLTHARYERVGGITGALPRRAEASYADMDVERQPVARRVLTELVRVGLGDDLIPDSRRRRTRGALINLVGDPADRVIDDLQGTRLVVVDGEGRDAAVELIHDALIREWFREDARPSGKQGLRQWVDEDRQELRFRQQVEADAERWSESRSNADLLRGDRLDVALRRSGWSTDRVDVPEYLAASRRARDRARRRRVTVFGVISLLAVVATGFGAWAVNEREIARQQEQIALHQARVAQSRQLAAQSIAEIDEHFDLALLLGVEGRHRAEGLSRTESFEARSALLSGRAANPALASVLNGHAGSVRSIAFSPDGRALASGALDGTVILWDVATRRRTGEPLDGAGLAVNTVAFSPDGGTLATGGEAGAVILWDVATRRRIGEPLDDNGQAVKAVAFSPDGATLAWGGHDGTVILWDVATRQRRGEPLVGHTSGVWSITFSPDGATLASGGLDGRVILWDVATRQRVGEPLVGIVEGLVSSVAFSPDGAQLAAGIDDGTVMVWDAASRQPIGEPLSGHTSSVWSVAFSPDGTVLAAGALDGTVTLWDIATGQRRGEPLVGPRGAAATVAFSPDGSTLAAGGLDGAVGLWDLATLQRGGEAFLSLEREVSSVAFSPDWSTLAAGAHDGTVSLWDLATWRRLGEPLVGHTLGEWSVAFSPDGTILASAGAGDTVILWDVVSRQRIGELLAGQYDITTSIAFSPDGTVLASGDYGGTLTLWDVMTRQRIGELLAGQAVPVNSVAFSPDGTTLASGSDDGVRLWDVASRHQLGELLAGQAGLVNSVAFSPDGTTLASGSDDGVRLWDVATRHQLGELLAGHTDYVNSVAFDPDGTVLASGGYDRVVILWDLATRRPLGEPLAGHGPVTTVAFSHDAGILASAGPRGNVVLLDISEEASFGHACGRANRNLSQAEWDRYFPGEQYRRICPELPSGDGVADPSPTGSP